MSDWREEARGIVPWHGAWLTNAHGDREGLRHLCLGSIYTRLDAWDQEHGTRKNMDARSFVLDLTHADTLAAFDRRLALRLGAPEEAVREGVTFTAGFNGNWYVTAGVHPDGADEGQSWYRWCEHRSLGTDDPLLARVRAWKSVP